MNLEIEKIKSATLYLAEKVPNLYFTKYLKLMYYLDFLAVLERGEPVTKDTYYHLPYGPVPSFIKDQLSVIKPEVKKEERRNIEGIGTTYSFVSIFTGLIKLDQKNDGSVLVVEAGKKSNLEYLSAYEQSLLDDIVKDLGQKTSTELVEKTHSEIPFIQTSPNNVIDYKLAFYLDRTTILPSRIYSFNPEVSQAEYFNS